MMISNASTMVMNYAYATGVILFEDTQRKFTRSKTPMIGTSTTEARSEAGAPHVIGGCPMTPIHATTARIPGTSRLIAELLR